MSVLSQIQKLTDRQRAAVVCVLLLLAVVGVYGRTLTFGFINLDDNVFVYDNPVVSHGLTWQGVKWAFTAELTHNSPYADYWMPLTILSRMADVSLYGLHAGGHHATNVLLHACNVCLLFLLWFRLTGRLFPGAFIAACFAVHPMHIESVAWVAERKDTLGAFFWLLTAHAYLAYARKRCWIAYALSLVLFVGGMMSKPLVVTLPVVLLLLDIWPLARLPRWLPASAAEWRQVGWRLLEKAPYVVLACVAIYVTLRAHEEEGATTSLAALGWGLRLTNLFASCAAYLGKLVWPIRLAVLYPWTQPVPAWQVAAGVVLVIGFSVWAVLLLRRQPFVAVGWFWFLEVVFPTLGLIQLGPQRMANRFVYLAYPGLYLIVAEGWRLLAGRQPALRRAGPWLGCLVVIALAGRSVVQLGHWRNSISLFSYTLSVTRNNALAHNNLAVALQHAGRDAQAAENYRRALALQPNYPDALNNLGALYLQEGKPAAAAPILKRAVAVQPSSFDAHMNLAQALLRSKDLKAAQEAVRAAVALDPAVPDGHELLGVVLAERGLPEKAAAAFRAALQRDPNLFAARLNLARCLSHTADGAGATAAFEKALAMLRPDTPAWRQVAEALVWHVGTHPNPGVGKRKEAAALAERLLKETPQPKARLLDAAAAAFAAAGRFPQAVATARRALKELDAAGKKGAAAGVRDRLQLYRQGRPYRRKPGSHTGE